jgi:hypothetical protein
MNDATATPEISTIPEAAWAEARRFFPVLQKLATGAPLESESARFCTRGSCPFTQTFGGLRCMPFRELRSRSGIKEPLRELRSTDNRGVLTQLTMLLVLQGTLISPSSERKRA